MQNKKLDKRTEDILCAVVQSYINAPGPVGSRFVTKKYSFGLSPATIRNIMSDLEELGYLRQPHTSAGRVPTEVGYRYYVDLISQEKQRSDTELFDELNRRFDVLRKDVNSFLSNASKMLSSLSHYIGITMSPSTSTTVLSKIELVKYKNNQIAVILLTDDGLIKHTIIPTDHEVSQHDLNRFAEYLNSEFSGLSLDQIRARILLQIEQEHTICDQLITDAITIWNNIFYTLFGNINVSGISEVLELPDFSDISRIKELLRTIEDKHHIMKLLNRISESDGPQVFIGSENPLAEMRKFSIVAQTYRHGTKPIGVIGIIGPTRMNYEMAIELVDITAHYITGILSNK